MLKLIAQVAFGVVWLIMAIALTGAARADDYPVGTPETMFEGDNRIGAFRAWDALFPTRSIDRGDRVSALEAGKPLKLAKEQLAFLARSDATGLIILKDGVIRLESYWLGASPDSRFTSMSMA